MCLFDILTRQQDRNATNYGFYKSDGIYNLYRLYDNGLSLFAASRFNDSKEFMMGKDTPTVEKLTSFCRKKLTELNVDVIFHGELKEDDLKEMFEPYREYIYKKNGNNIDDIISWIMNQYNYILNQDQ